jgi:predicted DNA-binding transcriptional regulator YafY
MTFNEVIKESISNNHRLEISYKDYHGKNSLRQISNIEYSNEFQKNSSKKSEHISAYCHLKNGKRTFKLNRIEKVRFVENTKNTNWVKNSSGCYIATMAYGSYEHPQVLILRKFRDDVLLSSFIGKLFVKVYYTISPKFVIVLKNQITINIIIRKILDKLIEKIIKY